MATVVWEGDASRTAQVSTATLNNDFNDAETDITLTLTAEDGSTTQSVSITPSGTDETVIAAALQAACAASGETLFQAITFTVATTVVTMTANVDGVPFYFGTAVTGGTGTITDATGTANSGPNDWNTAANWSGGTVPTAADDVLVINSSSSILFGLDQGSLNLTSLRIGESFRGDVGDSGNGYQLSLGTVTNAHLAPATGVVRLDATVTSTYIRRTAAVQDAVVLGGQASTLVLDGGNVRGEVRTLASMTLATVNVVDVAPGAALVIGASSSPTTFRMTSGRCEFSGSGVSTLDLAGGTFVMLESATLTTCDVYSGATLDYQSSGTIATVRVVGGQLTFERNRASAVTVTNATLIGGTINLRNNLDNVTVTNDIVVQAGRVISDQGVTVSTKV